MTAISVEIERFNRLSATWWNNERPRMAEPGFVAQRLSSELHGDLSTRHSAQ